MAKTVKVSTATAKGALGKVVGVVIGIIVVIIALVKIFNFANTATNEIGLHYGGGIIEDRKFKSIIAPGSTNQRIGPGDTFYVYPIDQRSYIIGGAGADSSAEDEVTVVSKDNVRLGVRVQVYFTLNRDPAVLQNFHERIGLKTDAYTDSGWLDHAAGLLPAADRPGPGRGGDQLRLGRALQQRGEEGAVPDGRGEGVHPAATGGGGRRLLPAGRPTTAPTAVASCRSRSRSRTRWTRASSTASRPSSAPNWPARPRSRRTSRSRSSCSRSAPRWHCSGPRATCSSRRSSPARSSSW